MSNLTGFSLRTSSLSLRLLLAALLSLLLLGGLFALKALAAPAFDRFVTATPDRFEIPAFEQFTDAPFSRFDNASFGRFDVVAFGRFENPTFCHQIFFA